MEKSILIVDDSFSLRQTISIALKAAGYNVVEASDGRDALARLDGRKFNLVISDLNMPNLDGLSFVREMKQMTAYRFTPVIMLTTESGEALKQEGKAAGIRAWVHKPFQPTVLLEAVAKLVLP
ncbi:response regulator [Herbaspirillum sp. alder98]|uniref:response regulator n=1 Tax=Herbaspirillum sp. alder98 TaxID=2913096 RepID=UPI001CD8B704|nr:response regulator [Herbaspirillum sp. alder98]MCA1325310.1 response regulator [Herbaspirillum sp. alder98]